MNNKANRVLPWLFVAAFAAGSLTSANAATVSLSAHAGNTGVDYGVDGSFDALLGGSFSLAVQALRDVPPICIGGIDPTGEERRGVLEYDLSGIAGTVISATIAPDLLNFSLPHPDLEVFVYSANGLVTLSDMTATGTLVFQNQISGAPMGPINVTDTLQTLIDGGATHFGVRIQVTGDPNFTTWGNGNGRFTTLNITTIPLPPALWLLGSGMFGLIAVAGRKGLVIDARAPCQYPHHTNA